MNGPGRGERTQFATALDAFRSYYDRRYHGRKLTLVHHMSRGERIGARSPCASHSVSLSVCVCVCACTCANTFLTGAREGRVCLRAADVRVNMSGRRYEVQCAVAQAAVLLLFNDTLQRSVADVQARTGLSGIEYGRAIKVCDDAGIVFTRTH
jgi:hypothetical protein